MRKKVFYLTSLFLLLIISAVSCSRENSDIEISNNETQEVLGYKVSNFLDEKKISELKSSIINNNSKIKFKNNQVSENSVNDIEQYNFNDVRMIEDTLGNVYYSIPKIGNRNEVIGLIPSEDNFKLLHVKIDNLPNSNIKIIEYKNSDNVLFARFGYDEVNNTFLDLEKSNITTMNISNNNLQTMRWRSCGQGVMDCMSNIYTKRGWTSVAATIFTAYAPEIAVAVAAGCAASRCL